MYHGDFENLDKKPGRKTKQDNEAILWKRDKVKGDFESSKYWQTQRRGNLGETPILSMGGKGMSQDQRRHGTEGIKGRH